MAVGMVGREDEELGNASSGWKRGGSDRCCGGKGEIVGVSFGGVGRYVGDEAVGGGITDY